MIIERYRAKNVGVPRKQLFLATPKEREKCAFISRVPTFREFVLWALENRHYRSFEIHWRPIYQQCSVCHPSILSTLNYILKFEELEEQNVFINLVNWTHIIQQTAQSNVYSKLSPQAQDITKLYFKLLRRGDVLKLYKKYRPDFLLFNYTFKLVEWL